MSIHWKAVEQYFTVLPFVLQFYQACNFGKFSKLQYITLKIGHSLSLAGTWLLINHQINE